MDMDAWMVRNLIESKTIIDNMATSEDIIAAGIIILLGLNGVFINLYVIYAVNRTRTFGYAFGRICISHTVANLGITSVFALLVGPITLLAPWFDTYWGHRCGQILIMFWNAAVFSHLLIAINRFVCLTWPMNYDNIFRKNVTNFSIAAAWILAMIQVAPYFSEDCTFGFTLETYSFKFYPGLCGFLIGMIFDYYMSMCMVGIIASIDFCTYLKIRSHHNKVGNLHRANPEAHRKKDRKFFFQACAQGLAFLGELISFFTISSCAKGNKWWEFVFTTVAWIMVHTLDGIIVIVFHKKIRRACCYEGSSPPTRSNS